MEAAECPPKRRLRLQSSTSTTEEGLLSTTTLYFAAFSYLGCA